jgi:transposase-like protein
MKTWVATCPECGSADVVYEAGMMLGQKYRCQKCGYIGSFVLEKEIDVEKGVSGEHHA